MEKLSSRIQKLKKSFLNEKFKGAISYDRIAGYFSSSILELTYESLENIEGEVRIICNSDLSHDDIKTAKLAKDAMWREWNEKLIDRSLVGSSNRFIKLYELLKTNKVKIRVLPNERFGLIHAKAGVIRYKDKNPIAFLGSMNESYAGWNINYEMVWIDEDKETVNWTQEEFDSLWNDETAIDLSEMIIEDIKRMSSTSIIGIDTWKENYNVAEVMMNTPIHRNYNGLWDHQRYFVEKAFKMHMEYGGARYVLADGVGLGKTIQLGAVALLIALSGDKPILIITPKSLTKQWQNELMKYFEIDCAVWDKNDWKDINNLSCSIPGARSIDKCPTKIGIISNSVIINEQKTTNREKLLNLEYDCVIIDEAHKCRRDNLKKGAENQKPVPNRLMEFLLNIAPKTKSMIMATATPIQLNPIEAWDLLYVLNNGNNSVLGDENSFWIKRPKQFIEWMEDSSNLDYKDKEFMLNLVRNPMILHDEFNNIFDRVRNLSNMKKNEAILTYDKYDNLNYYQKEQFENEITTKDFFDRYNPFITHVVIRTRDFLENNFNKYGENYMQKVEVELFGEKDEDTIESPFYLKEAYDKAEKFCSLFPKKNNGFIKTLLLRRLGSSMISGLNTAKKMLDNWGDVVDEEYNYIDYEGISIDTNSIDKDRKITLTEEQKEYLREFINILEKYKDSDPKFNRLEQILMLNNKYTHQSWKTRGCIVFSQYYDSIYWIGEKLSSKYSSETIGVYAGTGRSGLFKNGEFIKLNRTEIASKVQSGEIKILLGTDAASEGINLQKLGTLINLDLPWNPTRLEQRKGRIQRIGQLYNRIYIYNMRYSGSVEDNVHKVLSSRLEDIYKFWGQIPETLEDIWINTALKEKEDVEKKIDSLKYVKPFKLKYELQIPYIEWHTCDKLLNRRDIRNIIKNSW